MMYLKFNAELQKNSVYFQETYGNNRNLQNHPWMILLSIITIITGLFLKLMQVVANIILVLCA